MEGSILHSTILYFLHLVYETVLFISNSFLYIVKLFWRDTNTKSGSTDLSRFRKIQHLAVVLGNEDPSYKDLANLTLWSSLSNMRIISFYDHNGVLKITKTKLYAELDKNNIKYDKGPQGNTRNGTSQPIYVNVVSMEDGQTNVVEVIKSCAINKVKRSDLGMERLDEEVRKRTGEFSDPDVALYCGPVCSTYGLMPWQIHQTEFVNIGTHHNIGLNTFIKAVMQFDKIQKKFGN